MTDLTDYGEQQVIGHAFRDDTWAKPNAGNGIWIMGFIAMPGEAGAGTEADYAGYARIPIDHDNAKWNITPVTEGVDCANLDPESFPTPTANGTALAGYGVVDAATGGNIIIARNFTGGIVNVVSGTPITFAPGDMVFRVADANGRLCDDFGIDILGHIFTAAVWAKYSSLEIELQTTLVGKAGTGGIPYSGNGYNNAPAGPNASVWGPPAAVGGNTGTINAIDMIFGVPSADWTGIAGQALKAGSNYIMRLPYGDAPRTYPNGSERIQVTAGKMTAQVG